MNPLALLAMQLAFVFFCGLAAAAIWHRWKNARFRRRPMAVMVDRRPLCSPTVGEFVGAQPLYIPYWANRRSV